jgi:hypothetical protein
VGNFDPIGRLIAHNGGNPAYSCDFVWLPDQQTLFYIHGNNSLVRAADLREELGMSMLDPDTPLPPVVKADRSADPAVASARAGRYRAGGSTLRAVTDDVRLIITPEGQEAIDAFLGHAAEERRDLAALSMQTAGVIEALLAGREDALAGLAPEGRDPAVRARALMGILGERGQVQSATVLGSACNAPGSQLNGQSLTFVRLEYARGAVLLRMFWADAGYESGIILGTITNAPTFVLVPRAGGGYTAVEPTAVWARPYLPRDQAPILEADRTRAPGFTGVRSRCSGGASVTSGLSGAMGQSHHLPVGHMPKVQ